MSGSDMVVRRAVRAAAVAACALAAASSCAPAASAQPLQRRTVLAVFWSPEELQANQDRDAAFRSALAAEADEDVDYFAEYLETDRFPGQTASLALRDYIRAKFRGRRIDVVIAITDVALQFVLAHRESLFPDAAIVYLGQLPPEAYTSAPQVALTGVVTASGIAETLNLALRMHPPASRVLVVARWPGVSIESLQDELRDAGARVPIQYLHDLPLSQLLQEIARAEPGSLILYVRYSEDAADSPSSTEVARLVAETSPVPVYAVSGGFIGQGVVGGAVFDPVLPAHRVGSIVSRILDGESPRDIPLERAPLVPTFDWRQLRRWGIDESLLPPGASIRFRVRTVWDLYRGYIVAAATLIGLQAMLIGGLLAQRARRRRAEEAMHANEAALRRSYERARRLAGRLITAKEGERTRFARDLHDHVGQELAGLSLLVSELRRDAVRSDESLKRTLSTLQHRTMDLAADVRRLSHDLHPSTLRHVGLVAALEGHCLEIEQRYDVQVGFRTAGDLRRVPPEAALCLFRIAQEAMRNAATHGEARRLEVSLTRSERWFDLTVMDDGTGFDVDAVSQHSAGLGLVSMEERAHLLMGHVEIGSRRGAGTTVCARVPAGDAAPAAHPRGELLSPPRRTQASGDAA